MNHFFSFFLLSLLALGCLSQDASSSFDINQYLLDLANQQKAAKDVFSQNRSNLNSISAAENQFTLTTNDIALKRLQDELQKMKQEQERIQNLTNDTVPRPDQVNSDIMDFLNQQPHILFDESSQDDSGADQVSADEQNEIVLAQYCTKAFVDSIPPSFCLKVPIELGTFDVRCANGDQEILGFCYGACPSGYIADGITCGTACPSGYSTNALTCYKNFFNWRFRSFRARDWYTKFDSRAYCQTPKIKEIFLLLPKCFLDCGEIDLVNCGPHTCGMTQPVCKENLKNIIKDLIMGIGKLFLEVVTFGLSGLITSLLANPNAMYNAAKAAGTTAMQEAYNNVKVWMGRVNQDKLLSGMVSLTNSYIASNATLQAAMTQDRVTNRCASVRDIFYEKLVNTPGVNLEWKDFTSKDLRDYVDMCKQANQGDACKTAIRQSVLKWDPTGIVSMVSAFKQTNCPNIS